MTAEWEGMCVWRQEQGLWAGSVPRVLRGGGSGQWTPLQAQLGCQAGPGEGAEQASIAVR